MEVGAFSPGDDACGVCGAVDEALGVAAVLQSEESHLLYLEDDVVVTEEFDDTVAEAMDRNHEVVFLGGGHHTPPEGEGRWSKCRKTFNNHALLLNRVGARKLLTILGRWTEAWSDRELQGAMGRGAIEAWCVDPWVAFQRATNSDNWGNLDCVELGQIAPPMMLPDDLAVLDAALNFSKVVLEFGSGASTLHLGARLKDWGRLVSIEHSLEWYEKVRGLLADYDLPVELVLKEPMPLREGDGPWRFLPGQMRGYIEGPLEMFEEGEVDLVFVDGRERVACALAVRKILKPGGLLMIHDFWGRAGYRDRLPELLVEYECLFESPMREGDDSMGLAVFRRREAEEAKGLLNTE